MEVFMADFDGFDFVVKSLAAFDFVDIVKSLAAFDFAALFRTFFGVDVAFATFDPDLEMKRSYIKWSSSTSSFVSQ